MSPILRVAMASAWFMVSAVGRADVTVVEYYHSGFDHHFITPVAAEIALLDAKAPPFELWSRTGVTFRAYDSNAAPAGSVAMCRFFNSSFAPKSSHFYAPKGLGCETTLANYPDWGLEDDRLFAAMLPDASGACPGATVPVYRLYNQGLSGAPNHRFVISLAERQQMLDKGYLAEGAGIGVGMCVPGPVVNRMTAEGIWRGTTNQGQAVIIVILDDGTFYIVFSQRGSTTEAGVIHGSSSSVNGVFTAANVKEYPLSPDTPPFIGGAATIQGTYVPGTTLQLAIGSSSVSASYDPAYDQLGDLYTLAGAYEGSTGHITEQRPAHFEMDTRGNLTIFGVECNLAVSPSPRGAVNMFNISVSSPTCYNGPGILFYDSTGRKLYALAAFHNTRLGFPDMWYGIGTRR